MNTKKDNDAKPLAYLGEYDWPGMPAERTVLTFLDRVKEMISTPQEEPAINAERLHRTTKKRRDDVTAPPACGPLMHEIDTAIQQWLQEREAGVSLCLLVLPPCEKQDVLAMWAEDQGTEILNAPDRSSLLNPLDEPVTIQGEDVLVIPDLAYWFLRHQNGLTAIKSLLLALSTTNRPCIVGCNSWAWQFLSRAVDAEHYLPYPLMFQAFDSYRLRHWFDQMAQDSDSPEVHFRESGTGQDVLALDDDGELVGDYLKSLAARSFGIPWVAWHIWRRSLRTVRDKDRDDEGKDEGLSLANIAEDDTSTLWLVDNQDLILAEEGRELALLILHALLLHASLSKDHVNLVVPMESTYARINSLTDLGFIVENDGVLTCCSAAYPAIRTYLTEAGFPVDTL